MTAVALYVAVCLTLGQVATHLARRDWSRCRATRSCRLNTGHDGRCV